MVLVLQTGEGEADTGVVRRAGTEVAAAVENDAQIVRLGKILGVGRVKAVGDVWHLDAEVSITADA